MKSIYAKNNKKENFRISPPTTWHSRIDSKEVKIDYLNLLHFWWKKNKMIRKNRIFFFFFFKEREEFATLRAFFVCLFCFVKWAAKNFSIRVVEYSECLHNHLKTHLQKEKEKKKTGSSSLCTNHYFRILLGLCENQTH